MDVIGCTPTKLQEAHSKELFKLIQELKSNLDILNEVFKIIL